MSLCSYLVCDASSYTCYTITDRYHKCVSFRYTYFDGICHIVVPYISYVLNYHFQVLRRLIGSYWYTYMAVEYSLDSKMGVSRLYRVHGPICQYCSTQYWYTHSVSKHICIPHDYDIGYIITPYMCKRYCIPNVFSDELHSIVTWFTNRLGMGPVFHAIPSKMQVMGISTIQHT